MAKIDRHSLSLPKRQCCGSQLSHQLPQALLTVRGRYQRLEWIVKVNDIGSHDNASFARAEKKRVKCGHPLPAMHQPLGIS